MTNTQENSLSMYFTFRDFQPFYVTVTNALPNYSTNLTTFLNVLPQIQGLAAQQKASRKGVAGNKESLREKLEMYTEDTARKLGVWAHFTENKVLAAEVDLTSSTLHRSSDTGLKDYAQLVYDRAQTNIAALGPYGINAAGQTAFLTAMNAYNASLGKPGLSRTESKKITKALAAAFKVADTALENMDASVEIVRLSNPTFYSSYKDARKIIDNGVSKLVLKGKVTDAKSGEPIRGALVSFVREVEEETEKASKSKHNTMVKKSAKKGGFNVKSLPPGMYTLKVSKVGYAAHTATIAVAEGELTKVKIELLKR